MLTKGERLVMNRVAIITFTSGFNYGNRLQNYAVQELLRELELFPQTIRDDMGRFIGIKRLVKDIVSPIYRLFRYAKISKLTEWERKSAFERFNRKYINMSNYSIFQKKFMNHVDNFDYFVVGSDQVWNPHFIESDYYFLSFAPMEKRIALSASIGIDTLPESVKESYKRLIEEIPFVSVREDKAADIISELGLPRPIVLTDPTLAITKEKWRDLSNLSKFHSNEDYILTYFLGEISDNQKEQINHISKKYSWKIINPLNENNRMFYSMNPADFINAIENAKLIITDSFHGTVFSIIFHKKFIVFNRKCKDSMVSRLDTLLKIFDLSEQMALSDMNLERMMKKDIKFDSTDKIIEEERIKVLGFLKTAINGCTE